MDAYYGNNVAIVSMKRNRIRFIVFAAYGAASLALGDVSPFCSYDMFSGSRESEAAVSFRASGAPARLFDYTDFDVPDLSAFYPGDFRQAGPPGGDLNLTPAEMYSYILGHPGDAGLREEVEIVMVRSGFDEATRQVTQTARTLCRGTARRR